MAEPGWTPTGAEAALLRDHIASFLHSAPEHARALADQLLAAVRRPREAAPVAVAAAYRALAETRLYSGEYKAAEAAYERACAFAAKARAPRLLGQILVGRIGTLQAMGEFGAVGAMARRAEGLLARSGDQDYLRRLHINLGSGHFHRERYAEAHASFAAALRMMNEAGQRDDVWASLTLNLGIALSELARVAEARSAFRTAEAYGRAHGQDRLVAQALFNQGVLEGLRGGYRAALGFLAEAEATFERQGVRELLAATRLEQAQIYLDLAMPAEAEDLAARAGASFAEEGMLLDAHLARLAAARALLQLGRMPAAIELLAEAEDFYRRRRIHARRAQVLLDLAQARLAQGDHKSARQMAAAALRTAIRLGLESMQCACRCLQAEVLLQAGREAAAAEVALTGIDALLPRLPVRDRLLYWSTAARVARAAGKRALAERRYRQASRFLEAQRALIPGLELRARSYERTVRIYHEQIALAAASPRTRIDRVLTLMERARGRTFRELLETRGRRAEEDLAEQRAVLGSLVRRLDHLRMRALPRRTETTGDSARESQEAEQLERQIRAREREITARVRRLETGAPGATGRATFRGVGRLAALLAPDEVLIEYFVTEGRILAAIVGRERRVLRTLAASAAEIARELDHLRLQMETLAATAQRMPGNLGFLRRRTEARLGKLFAALLEPLLPDLPAGGRLTIVPHDLLHQVPFECLHDGAAYLDRSWLLSRCPTADFLIERRSRPAPAATGRTVVIAGLRPGSPFIAAEARAVLDCYGRRPGELLLDPAPEAALAAMREAGVIHVSSHGTFRADNPLFSTLHLGSGVLFLADVLTAPLSAELVVVSACNSGQTFSGRGDALLGMAHAFLAADARRLVASLWRVHDQATADWMQTFHRVHQEIGDTCAAYRSTVQALRERWPHPFYWGGFCVLGA